MCAEPIGRLRALGRATRGAAALEFAAVMPVFLMLVFAIIDISRYAFTLISVREAAAVAVRAAAMGQTETAVQALARRHTPFVANGLAVTCTGCGVTNPNQAMSYSITARFTFQPLLPMLPTFQTTITERTGVRY